MIVTYIYIQIFDRIYAFLFKKLSEFDIRWNRNFFDITARKQCQNHHYFDYFYQLSIFVLYI